MEEKVYKVVEWPSIQNYMDLDGFEENSYLINDEKGMNEFGSSAYFIEYEWLKQANRKIYGS